MDYATAIKNLIQAEGKVEGVDFRGVTLHHKPESEADYNDNNNINIALDVDEFGSRVIADPRPDWFPTWEEATAEATRLHELDAYNTYQRTRKKKYPDFRVLADALYWQSQGDNSKMEQYLADVQAVKDAFPKPETPTP